jgi:hypothetical protein
MDGCDGPRGPARCDGTLLKGRTARFAHARPGGRGWRPSPTRGGRRPDADGYFFAARYFAISANSSLPMAAPAPPAPTISAVAPRGSSAVLRDLGEQLLADGRACAARSDDQRSRSARLESGRARRAHEADAIEEVAGEGSVGPANDRVARAGVANGVAASIEQRHRGRLVRDGHHRAGYVGRAGERPEHGRVFGRWNLDRDASHVEADVGEQLVVEHRRLDLRHRAAQHGVEQRRAADECRDRLGRRKGRRGTALGQGFRARLQVFRGQHVGPIAAEACAIEPAWPSALLASPSAASVRRYRRLDPSTAARPCSSPNSIQKTASGTVAVNAYMRNPGAYRTYWLSKCNSHSLSA